MPPSNGFGWKRAVLAILLIALFGFVIGLAESLGIRSLWYRYAVKAATSVVLFLFASALWRITDPDTENAMPKWLRGSEAAIGFGLLMGGLLLLPWWVFLLIYIGLLVALQVLSRRRAACTGDEGEDTGSHPPSE